MANLIKARTDSDLETLQGDWRYRCIDALRANQSPLGTILLAILGRGRDKLPRLATSCEIDERGMIQCAFVDEAGVARPPSPLAPVDTLIGAFRTLADKLDLPDADRAALFDEFRKWVKRDHRAASPNLESNL